MRVAVVTGSNKGIGFGIVKHMLQHPFDGHVYLTSRDVGRGEAAVKELQALGLDPKFHQLDIDNPKSIETLRDYLVDKYGGLDVLVNNAAIAFKNNSTAPFLEQVEVTLKTNYFALKSVCHVLFPILKPHARVVNVSSSAGMLRMIPGAELKKRFADPQLTEDKLDALANEFISAVRAGDHQAKGWPNTAYGVSKVSASALSFIQQRAFDKDERPDIVVNAVHPGFVDTDMTSHKGHLTIEQGADAPSYLALLPPNVDKPRGAMVWLDRKIVDWQAE